MKSTNKNMIQQAFESTQDRIKEVTLAMQELLLEKNKRYGDAAINPTNTFSKLSGQDSIKIRLDDKLKRVQSSEETRVNDVCDIIGYCTLLLISMRVSKEDILKLID